MRANGTSFDWLRVPLAGGDPIYLQAPWSTAGWSTTLAPTLAALMPRPAGTRFRLPGQSPVADGTMRPLLLEHQVNGTERLSLLSGVSCECWVIDQVGAADGTHRFWVTARPRS